MKAFNCIGCGGNKLGYQKYIKSVMLVDIHSNGNISYGEPVIDYDDDIPVSQGYVCRDCGCQVYHTGEWLSTEQEIQGYLSASPETLEEQQMWFDEYLDEQANLFEERQERHEFMEMGMSEVN